MLDRLHRQMPHVAAKLDEYLQFYNVLDEFQSPAGPIVLYNLDVEARSEALRKFPRLADFYRSSPTTPPPAPQYWRWMQPRQRTIRIDGDCATSLGELRPKGSTMTPSRIDQAARNNAIWCDTVCRAHGAPGEFHDAVWINRQAVPRFYPNVVTLSGPWEAARQRAHIQALVASGLPGCWGVKDSYCALDLTDLGLQVLFEATWLWRAPFPTTPHSAHTRTQWTWARSVSELAHWETAWSGDPANTSSAPPARLFVPVLFTDPEVAFIAAYHDDAIVAGAIANRTGDVVGVSNVFTPLEDRALFWAGCVATVQARFPGLPLVSYQRGPELAMAQAVGFEKVHELRVWTRQV